jgi:hypothetical protein
VCGVLCRLGEPAQNLVTIFEFIKEEYKRLRISDRFGQLHLNMFTSARSPNSSFPKLKGKGAEIKGFGEPLLHAWERWMSNDDVQHVRVKLLLGASVKLEHMLVEHADLIKFPTLVADDFLSTTVDLLLLATALAKHYNEMGRKLWDITPKAHYLFHCAYNARFLNPRLSWCYSGEDYMQKIKRVAQSCVRGTPLQLVGRRIAVKFVRGFTFRFLQRDRWWR